MIKTIKELKAEATQLKTFFQSPDGKSAFKALETEFSDRISHTPGDPYATAFNEGQRSVILFIKDIVETNYE